MTRHLHGPVGRIEALLDDPGALCTTGEAALLDPSAPPVTLRAAVVLAHPHPLYGGTMHTKSVFQAAKAFCRLGCAVLRFNFRGTGASDGTFDEGRGELLDFAAAVDYMAARYPWRRDLGRRRLVRGVCRHDDRRDRPSREPPAWARRPCRDP